MEKPRKYVNQVKRSTEKQDKFQIYEKWKLSSVSSSKDIETTDSIGHERMSLIVVH